MEEQQQQPSNGNGSLTATSTAPANDNRPGSAFGGSVTSDSPSTKDILDVKLEILLRQWAKSVDILFTIHPVDGSLVTWTVEWLDDMHRQPTISYTSRFPGALPVTDAASLHPTLNTFNPHEPMYVDVLRRDDGREIVSDRLLERRISNTVHVLTNHENGTLNLWHMAVDENSHFTQILSITHMSRMCGHRFQIKQVVAHPVLPLLLTTSQFSSNSPAMEQAIDPSNLSEVILWKISPVGPLCKSGGVKELARVASPSKQEFAHVGWIPAILPSSTLGSVCNSPSSCFIASDGKNLVIYQAVIDARALLSEIYNSVSQDGSQHVQNLQIDDDGTASLTPSPRHAISHSVMQQFNVVSTQSTARPGCVLELGRIADAVPSGPLLLLHVYNARMVVDEVENEPEEGQNRMGSVIDRSKTAAFRDQFFIVMVEQGKQTDRFLMYSLTISSQTPQPITPIDPEQSSLDDRTSSQFLRPASPIPPSVARLSFDAELVCSQNLPLPDGARLTSVASAAGHLPSSTLYPACQAPYVIVTTSSGKL
ncbi:hypothetical protein WR25_00481 [Diploscapter pachys]|uniref:Uncharacterized protein n=1 Tax=Diploscapter pachys TaxID=2018661 RepID=A0A2A2KJ33_9BILA|nr:hypothetical protein WR25_00481 [Diploscapter pachys]